MLEQHRERADKESREARARAKAEKKAREKAAASKKRKKGEGEGEEEGDGTGWEYRPWNRDTDLEAGRQSTKKLNPEEMMKKAGGDLKGRFGSSGGASRSFL